MDAWVRVLQLEVRHSELLLVFVQSLGFSMFQCTTIEKHVIMRYREPHVLAM